MPCYRPLQAFQCSDGQVVFQQLARHDVVRSLDLPCGQCIGCRLERSRQWAVRCVHESKCHKRNCFVTLTYDDDHLPLRGQLNYPDFQKFMRRVRKQLGPVRFYMCGEYGSENWRPHYHACLFGLDFDDKVYWRKSESGAKCYRSAVLEQLWPLGASEIGALTFESAAYAARYCVQKITGQAAQVHYARSDSAGDFSLPAEFNKMSLKPGIGARFLHRWHTDIYPNDFVVINWRESKPPRYYDKLFSRLFPSVFEDVQFRRQVQARESFADNTLARLAVKEVVATARSSFLSRSI